MVQKIFSFSGKVVVDVRHSEDLVNLEQEFRMEAGDIIGVFEELGLSHRAATQYLRRLADLRDEADQRQEAEARQEVARAG